MVESDRLAQIVYLSILLFFFYRVWRSGGLKRMFEEGKTVPQRWDVFGLLMLAVLGLVYLLYKL